MGSLEDSAKNMNSQSVDTGHAISMLLLLFYEMWLADHETHKSISTHLKLPVRHRFYDINESSLEIVRKKEKLKGKKWRGKRFCNGNICTMICLVNLKSVF